MQKMIKFGLIIGITIAFLTPISLVLADTIPPTVNILYPNGGEVASGEITISWSAFDNETMNLNGTILIEYSPDNGNSWNQIASHQNNTGMYLWNTASVPNGNQYLIRVSATDEYNNTGSDMSNNTFSIDNIDTIPPYVLVIYPNGGEVVSGEIDIQWFAYDNVTMNLNGTILIEYSPDNGNSWNQIASHQNNTGVYLWNTTVVPDGDNYLIAVSATDEAFNVGSDESNTTFSIKNVLPELPHITGPSQGGNGITFNFTVVATDPNGEQMYYQWDWGDGNNTNWLGPFDSGVPLTTSYVWVNDGNYNMRVKAKNAVGSESSSEHPMIIAEQINFSNLKLGYIYFNIFTFNKSYVFSNFLLRLGVVFIFSTHELSLEGSTTDVVKSVDFKAEHQTKLIAMKIIDNDGSNGFSCSMNVTRGTYTLNITAYDENGTLLDRYSLKTVFFIRMGRYATEPIASLLQYQNKSFTD